MEDLMNELAESDLSQDLKDFQKEAFEFFRKEAPEEWTYQLMEEQHCSNPFSQELHEKITKKGYLSLSFPKEYGGQGLSSVFRGALTQTMMYSNIPHGNFNLYMNSTGYLGDTLVHAGTEEQKKRWLPKISRGEIKSAVGMTEPEAGTDAAACQARAVRKGNTFILNGTKLFSNAHNADWQSVVCRTTVVPGKKHQGISLLLVDLHSTGVMRSPTLITMGGFKRCEVSYTDVVVPEENIIGIENEGWSMLVGPWLATERGYLAGMNYGIIKRDFEIVLKYVKENELNKIPWVRYKMAEAYTRLENLRLLVYHVFAATGEGTEDKQGDLSKEASIAKVYSSEFLEWWLNLAMDILGTCGGLMSGATAYMPGSPDKERLFEHGMIALEYNDTQGIQTGGGASEIQRDQIAIRGLGLPRFKGK
ncbi:acyl-CoA dehydrogenase family protein [Chloroflexota bacterium]